ncbi:MAG: polysaccharide deacetylase family protein, partial [Burkholderiales bacterium]
MSLDSGGRRWQPAPAVRGAIALHAVAAGAVLFAPASWPWAVGAIAANHAVFFGASFLPRTRLIGANHSRLPASAIRRAEIALTFDDGPDPAVTPRLLDLLHAARAKATFFCVGEQVHRHPEIARAIVQRGHDLENHTQRHPQSFGFY